MSYEIVRDIREPQGVLYAVGDNFPEPAKPWPVIPVSQSRLDEICADIICLTDGVFTEAGIPNVIGHERHAPPEYVFIRKNLRASPPKQ